MGLGSFLYLLQRGRNKFTKRFQRANKKIVEIGRSVYYFEYYV